MISGLTKNVRHCGLWVSVGALLSFVNGCFVDSACYNDADCPDNRTCVIPQGAQGGTCKPMCLDDDDCGDGYLCEPTTHICKEAECAKDSDCRDDFECVNGRCRAMGELMCPEAMVPIERMFCIDVYEASRPDATATSPGIDESMAVSRAHVTPWRLEDDSNAVADSACRAAGKRLCEETEWQQACMGPAGTAYSYGETYNTTICNGIDTFCYCERESCQTGGACPFPGCFEICGGNIHIEPTGTFEGCTNGYGVFDINGNLWEHVLGGDDTRIRGGAFNCRNSKLLHRCDYIPGDWPPSAKGFRCCADGWIDNDAGV